MSHGFLADRHKLQGAASARIVDHRPAEGQLVQRVESAEYARTLTGVDRTRTNPAQTTYTWDLREHTCRWAWVGSWGSRVVLTGKLALLDAPEGHSELLSETRIEVNVPLLGGIIEKRIASEIQASMPAFEDLVRTSMGSGQTDVPGEAQGIDEAGGPKA